MTIKKIQILTYLLFIFIIMSCGNDDDSQGIINNAPEIKAQSFNVSEAQEAENTFATVEANDPDTEDVLRFSITKDDSEIFNIAEATGELNIKKGRQLDFDITQTYTLEITVTDGTLSAKAPITIIIIDSDVDANPEIKAQSFSVSEAQEAENTFATVEASDPDADDVLRFSITKDDNEIFDIVEATGELSIKKGRQLDFDITQTYTIEVTVTDGILSAKASITITVIDANMNASPEINAQSFEVSEAQEAENTFATVTANDPDSDDILSFSISKDNNNIFTIAETTGELAIKQGNQLDFETTQMYTIDVTVTDGTLSAKATITINIIDVDEAFVTTWEITTAGESIFIPTVSTETYNYTVDWGDNTTNTGQTGNARHTYAQPGVYTVSIMGDFPRIYFNSNSSSSETDRENAMKIKSIENWGAQVWTSMGSSFSGCTNLIVNAQNAPNLSQVMNMSFMFRSARSFNQSIGDWDVSNVTNMSGMFASAVAFNQSLNNWNVSNVIDMSSMFATAIDFNQDISSWNVSNVMDMSDMFNESISFNQGISSWNVSNVTNMKRMFSDANTFNQDLSGWETNNVTSCDFFSSSSALDPNNLPTKGCFSTR